MQTIQPSTTGRRTTTNIEPLVVSPREAWRLLSCGNTYGYALLASGELESYHDGRRRKIVVASIHRLIARRLASAGASRETVQIPRRRGRPRKTPVRLHEANPAR